MGLTCNTWDKRAWSWGVILVCGLVCRAMVSDTAEILDLVYYAIGSCWRWGVCMSTLGTGYGVGGTIVDTLRLNFPPLELAAHLLAKAQPPVPGILIVGNVSQLYIAVG